LSRGSWMIAMMRGMIRAIQGFVDDLFGLQLGWRLGICIFILDKRHEECSVFFTYFRMYLMDLIENFPNLNLIRGIRMFHRQQIHRWDLRIRCYLLASRNTMRLATYQTMPDM
jgi:hypothetical protein